MRTNRSEYDQLINYHLTRFQMLSMLFLSVKVPLVRLIFDVLLV
jgi:hypothetical protein